MDNCLGLGRAGLDWDIDATDYRRRGDRLVAEAWPGIARAVEPSAEAARLDRLAAAEPDADRALSYRRAAGAIRAAFGIA